MLKIGVFGAGHLGKFHLNNWKEITDVELIGFYDPNDDTAKEVSEQYQLPRFPDADALMDACDTIDVVAPTTNHFEWCEKAIKKGIRQINAILTTSVLKPSACCIKQSVKFFQR